MLKKNKFSLKNIKIIIFIFLSLMLVYVKITICTKCANCYKFINSFKKRPSWSFFSLLF